MTAIDLDHLVQPDRVHRSVYTDQALFDGSLVGAWKTRFEAEQKKAAEAKAEAAKAEAAKGKE